MVSPVPELEGSGDFNDDNKDEDLWENLGM